MRAIVSFCGHFHKYLGADRRWLGLIEAETPTAQMHLSLVPAPPEVGDPIYGGLGLARWDDKVVAALQWHQPVFVMFDAQLNFLSVIEAEADDVHSIAVAGDTLYVAVTGWDRLRAFRLPDCKKWWDVRILNDGSLENVHHHNSVTLAPGNRPIIAYHEDPIGPDAHVIIEDVAPGLLLPLPEPVKRLHSLRWIGEGYNYVGAAFCDSVNGRAWIGERWVGAVGYTRGLDFTADYAIVGSSHIAGDGPGPAVCCIEIFERQNGELVNRLDITERWEIYDILVLDN